MAEYKYDLFKEDLTKAAKAGRQVRAYLMNGFQMVGEPTGEFDNNSFRLKVDGKIKTIMFHALSTLEEV